MSKLVTIGGQRLGAGKGMRTAINDYERSTHNLSTTWTSAVACGLLYPSLVIPVTRGDYFRLKISSGGRTIPTKGPLYGSFKMQTDVFFCPQRLYQALLHNNPLALGLKMNQVKLPKLRVKCGWDTLYKEESGMFSMSSLLKYLGMSGIQVDHTKWHKTNIETWQRQISATPALAYYDIFKTYYANKQEKNAYMIIPSTYDAGIMGVTKDVYIAETFVTMEKNGQRGKHERSITSVSTEEIGAQDITIYAVVDWGVDLIEDCGFTYTYEKNGQTYTEIIGIEDATDAGIINIGRTATNKNIFLIEVDFGRLETYDPEANENQLKAIGFEMLDGLKDVYSNTELALEPFELANIDKMRMDILSDHTLGSSFIIGKDENDKGKYAPYNYLTAQTETGRTINAIKHVGLVTKCYQNDIFNNRLNAEWIEGSNGIAELTKVAVEENAFKIDNLILARKMYDMLNRVALSGATYEDYMDTMYEQTNSHYIESPVYCGGASGEIVFEEIVQTAPADGDPLGTLGGRGLMKQKNNGYVDIKVDEYGYIIAITSLTPRLVYTQGNEFYMTELDSIDDFHKPALDAIAFQNLMTEQLCWSGTEMEEGSSGDYKLRRTSGKLPAWINYMTNIDRAYGDLAEDGGEGYMILNRNYKWGSSGVKDSTYIDPEKFNYAFAYTKLDAQNFWLQVHYDIIARRLMSAKQIPNL